MACDLTAGRAKVCKDGISGNSKFYAFNSVEDAFTVVAGQATAINPALTTVFEYDLEGDGNTLVQNLVGDRNTGTTINTQTLTLILKKMDATTSAEMNILVKGYPQGVVKDRNGNYHAIGLDDGIDFTVDASTGGAKTDLNGYTLTGVATTGSIAPILDSATVTAFLALV
jgi:hypothetical protein